MNMKKHIWTRVWTMVAGVSLTAGLLAGCGSSSSDGDDAGDGGQTPTDVATDVSGDTATDGPALFGLTPNTYCYDITKIEPGFVDGCKLEVETLVGTTAIQGNYDAATGVFKLGREGSLGQGAISQNKGTLLRSNMPVDVDMPLCKWTQTDDTMIDLIATNEFTAAVVEKQSAFATACTEIPMGGMCMSTWKWTLKINGAKTVQADGSCK